MKYIKIFEEYNNIKKGNYVYLDSSDNINHSKSLNNFLKDHIGIIQSIDYVNARLTDRYYINVNFIFNDNDSEEIKNQFNHITPFKDKYILLHDSNLENLKIKINVLKYNL